VFYINSNGGNREAGLTSLSSTSGNVYHIVEHLPARRILFSSPPSDWPEPARRAEKRRGIDKEIITSMAPAWC